jgi:hypothetical protein
MLSNAATRTTVHTAGVDDQGDYMIIQNKLFRAVNTTQIIYRIQSYDVSSETTGALIDGGANGGMAGNDLRNITSTVPGQSKHPYSTLYCYSTLSTWTGRSDRRDRP